MVVRKAAALACAILLPFVVGAVVPELALQSGTQLALARIQQIFFSVRVDVVLSVPVLALLAIPVAFALGSRFPRQFRKMFWLPIWGVYASVALFLAFMGLNVSVSAGYDRYQPILWGSTTFAPGFDDAKFRLITPGTDVERVIQLVGPPLREFDDEEEGEVVYVFSDIGPYRRIEEKAYHQRWVVARDGKVVRVHRRYITTETDPLSY